MTRLPPRSPASGPEPVLEQIDDLEELGDDAIIAQQTAAHAPQPRANVSEESRSVVITEHALPARPAPRSSAEATLVIRDRRALDELRSAILRKKNKQSNHRRAFYWWGALGLTAFVLGGVAAFLATDSHSEPETESNSAPARNDAPSARPHSEALPAQGPAASSSSADASRSDPARAVRLDDLPVEARPAR